MKGYALGLTRPFQDRAVRIAESHATATATASGATAVVAAQGANKRIVVTGFILSSDAVVNVKFQSAASDLTALLYLPANYVGGMPDMRRMTLVCGANEALNINLSGTANVGVTVAYRVVDTTAS